MSIENLLSSKIGRYIEKNFPTNVLLEKKNIKKQVEIRYVLKEPCCWVHNRILSWKFVKYLLCTLSIAFDTLTYYYVIIQHVYDIYVH